MEKKVYQLLENYMISCMTGSAHDKEHVYRVLYVALDIAENEKEADRDILTAACLLHDIGRREQLENPCLCHARVGAGKAYDFLIANGFQEEFAEHVSACIRTHRFRASDPPTSLEAKILFDADKIDVTGAIGIARTLLYQGEVSEPLYTLTLDGRISDGKEDETPSFFREYKYKLENIHHKLFTERGREIAAKRQQAGTLFYRSLLEEVEETYSLGEKLIKKYQED